MYSKKSHLDRYATTVQVSRNVHKNVRQSLKTSSRSHLLIQNGSCWKENKQTNKRAQLIADIIH